jgi:hypothetical protein
MWVFLKTHKQAIPVKIIINGAIFLVTFLRDVGTTMVVPSSIDANVAL